jgi:hypothetical protein
MNGINCSSCDILKFRKINFIKTKKELQLAVTNLKTKDSLLGFTKSKNVQPNLPEKTALTMVAGAMTGLADQGILITRKLGCCRLVLSMLFAKPNNELMKNIKFICPGLKR